MTGEKGPGRAGRTGMYYKDPENIVTDWRGIGGIKGQHRADRA